MLSEVERLFLWTFDQELSYSFVSEDPERVPSAERVTFSALSQALAPPGLSPSVQVFSAGVQIQAWNGPGAACHSCGRQGAQVRPRRSREIRVTSDPRPELSWRERRCAPSPAGASRPQGAGPWPLPRSGRPGVLTTNPPSCPSSDLWSKKGVTVALIVGLSDVRAGAQPQSPPCPRCPQDPALDSHSRGPTASYGHSWKEDPVNLGSLARAGRKYRYPCDGDIPSEMSGAWFLGPATGLLDSSVLNAQECQVNLNFSYNRLFF